MWPSVVLTAATPVGLGWSCVLAAAVMRMASRARMATAAAGRNALLMC